LLFRAFAGLDVQKRDTPGFRLKPLFGCGSFRFCSFAFVAFLSFVLGVSDRLLGGDRDASGRIVYYGKGMSKGPLN
jgi:hypothetical protein